MIKFLTGLLIFTVTLTLITVISPALGYKVALLIGEIVAQPLLAALKLGLLIRGLV